jgi:hypothetical protein
MVFSRTWLLEVLEATGLNVAEQPGWWAPRAAWLLILLLGGVLSACTVQLVAPYNSELAQTASAMQAEVIAWDLQMRSGAGTISDDPRHPDVLGTLNKWQGEAGAMLTLAISNDPGTVNCGEAVKAVSSAIESRLPAELRAAAQPAGGASGAGAAAARGCEAALVASIGIGIEDVKRALKYCRADWIDDAYFVGLSQNRFVVLKPPAAPSPARQEMLTKSCFAEFRASSNAPADAIAGAGQGRAVSALLTTLQAIVYLEQRKKAALLSK